MTEQEFTQQCNKLLKIKLIATSHKNYKRAQQAEEDLSKLILEYQRQTQTPEPKESPVVLPKIILPGGYNY